MKIQELMEAIKGWKHAHSDLMKLREARSAESHNASLVRLKKDGTESRMHDAVTTYPTEQDARKRHSQLVKLNPGKDIRHNLYVDNKLVGVLDPSHLMEYASSGATSSAHVASVANPFGITMRRPSLFGYMPAPKQKKRKSRKSSSAS